MLAAGAALVALGTNQPFTGVGGAALLTQAVAALVASGIPVLARSSVWESEAWPAGSGQPNYCNAVISADARDLAPEQLFERLCAIEAGFGRVRRERWGPRTLDLDLLAMARVAGDFGAVTLPHPRLHERAFVLLPLAEVAPAWIHPLLRQTPGGMLAGLPPGRRPWIVGRLI